MVHPWSDLADFELPAWADNAALDDYVCFRSRLCQNPERAGDQQWKWTSHHPIKRLYQPVSSVIALYDLGA